MSLFTTNRSSRAPVRPRAIYSSSSARRNSPAGSAGVGRKQVPPVSAKSTTATFRRSHLPQNNAAYVQSLQHPASPAAHSPQSAWWKVTTALGSRFRHSLVDLAVTPKPSGMSAML